MAKPTNDEIAKHVRLTLAGFARRDVRDISDTDELTGALGFADEDFPSLALSLRGYVKMFNNANTITVGDLKKAKDVKGTIKLVQDRIA
jgi:hypothetical protein